jgi:uncharacterized Tic20 family protein
MTTEYACELNERGRAFEPGVTDDEKTWALFMHLSLILSLLVAYLCILFPIFMWINKKEKSRFIDDHGREAINFQISMFLYGTILPLGLFLLGVVTCGAGFFLAVAVGMLTWVLGVVGVIRAALAANRGEYFRYPMTIRFL